MPVSACSNLPMRVVAAPVNAPFSWPNSSLSRSSAGSAAQFTLTNGRSLRDDRWWMARATSSLPTPLSPRISTVTSLSDTCSITVRDRLHLGAVAPEQERPVLVVAQLPPQLGDLGHEPRLLDRALDGGVERDLAQPLGIVGFDDVVGGAEAHRLDDRRRLLAARQHDHLQVGLRRLQRAQRLEPVHAGHHHVEQHDVRRIALLDRGEHLVAARIGPRLVAAQREERPQVIGERGIVVDDGDVGFLQRDLLREGQSNGNLDGGHPRGGAAGAGGARGRGPRRSTRPAGSGGAGGGRRAFRRRRRGRARAAVCTLSASLMTTTAAV